MWNVGFLRWLLYRNTCGNACIHDDITARFFDLDVRMKNPLPQKSGSLSYSLRGNIPEFHLVLCQSGIEGERCVRVMDASSAVKRQLMVTAA